VHGVQRSSKWVPCSRGTTAANPAIARYPGVVVEGWSSPAFVDNTRRQRGDPLSELETAALRTALTDWPDLDSSEIRVFSPLGGDLTGRTG